MEKALKEQQVGSSWSDEHTVVISEDCPMIESATESSWSHRAGKMMQRVKQTEWVGELDIFSTPIKLTFNGDDSHKTEFGGFVYLLVMVACLVLTVIFQFPNGLTLDKPITFYSLLQDDGNTQTVFDHTDSFIEVYLINATAGTKISDTAELAFLLKGASIWQTINGASTQLELSQTCSTGSYCFKKSTVNQAATIYGTSATDKANLQLEVATCGVFDFFSSHPTTGQLCSALVNQVAIVVQVTNFIEETGGLRSYTEQFSVFMGHVVTTKVARKEYTTNNLFFGHLANLFPFDFKAYHVDDSTTSTTATQLDSTLGCFSPLTFSGNTCSQILFEATGTTRIYSQKFEDITAPLLFFLSVSQTLFYLIYLLFLRNYSNNCLYLRIADSLAYLPCDSGHHDFKSGFSVFVACLIHQHKLLVAVDFVLYHICKTQTKRYLPLKVQLTMDMIDYGLSCLSEKAFFDKINHIYQMENLQPGKIVVDFDEEDKEEEEAEEEQDQEMDRCFSDQVEEEAFQRMCHDHEVYTKKSKLHLAQLLKDKDKNYKLVLMTQRVFSRYREEVRLEHSSKEIAVPINYIEDELSGHQLRRNQMQKEFKESA